MFNSKSTLILAGCISGLVVAALLKYFYPSFVYYHIGILLVLLLTIFYRSSSYTYTAGVLGVLLLILSFQMTEAHNTDTILIYLINILITLKVIFVVLHIKKLNHSLEKEQKQMKSFLDFAKESIILISTNGEIILGNPAAQRLFGYDENEMSGRIMDTLISPHHNAGFNQYRSEILESPQQEKQAREMVAVKKSGEEFPVEINIKGYKQDEDLITIILIVDLSQRIEAENRFIKQKTQLEKITHDVRIMNIELENKVAERTLILQEALQELEKSQTELSDALNKEKELNEIKSRFVSMASHEFRTPLSTILSSASLLQKYQLNEEQSHREKHIRRIKDSVKHLNDMLEDFLNLGKIEEGRVFTEITEFDVKEFLQDIFDEMKINLKMGQQLKLSFEGENSFVTDKRLLKNVLITLLSNATKFSDIHKTIEIAVDNTSTFMIVQVKDQGIGIPKEDMPHLFSTFYRGRNAVNIQGTGLGLHIVKRYVDMLEGSITLSTELNEGTTFNIGLPNLKELV